MEGWDVISGHETNSNNGNNQNRFVPLVGALFDQVGRTLTRVSSVFQNIEDRERNEVYELPMPPLDDREFWTFLDPTGRLLRPKELRLRVYQGGVDHSLRKVVWRHLLNVFPDGLSGKERMEHVRVKSNEYEQLKRKLLNEPKEDFKTIMNMVRKDVLRTDRKEKFYAGGDENHNVNKLFNVLATYSLAHPDVSYCQGMSDLASPILYIMEDEAATYLCFCSLMKRLKGSFLPDGKAMSIRFLHLTELIRCVDPVFYEYLKEENADDLYFCYRWLLLELKREFAFHDALRMLEILWSSLPPNPPGEDGVELSGPPSNSSPSAFAVDRARFRFSRHHSVSREHLDMAGKTGVLSKTQSVDGEEQKLKECILHETGSNTNCENGETCSCKSPKKDGCCKEDVKMNKENAENNSSTEQSGPRHAVKPLTLPGHQSPNECNNLSPPSTGCKHSESRTPLILPDNDLLSDLDNVRLNSDVVELLDLDAQNSELSALDNAQHDGTRENSPFHNSSQGRDSGSSSRNESPNTPLISEQGSSSCKHSNESLYRNYSPPYSPLPDTPMKSPHHSSKKSPSSSISSGASSNGGSSASVTSSACSSTPRSTPREQRTVLGLFQQTVTTPNSSTAPMSPSEKSSLSRNQSPVKTSALLTPPPSPTRSPYRGLPPPQDFGGGNPFMMFMCLAILLDQRNVIIANRMDYNEMAMLFDRMIRKHNLGKVLHKSRALYADYLQSEAVESRARVQCVNSVQSNKPLPANGHVHKAQESLL